MKANRNHPRPVRRQIFVLTPEEKRTICFVLVMFALGVATKHYRENHPVPLPKPTASTHVTPKPSPRLRP